MLKQRDTEAGRRAAGLTPMGKLRRAAGAAIEALEGRVLLSDGASQLVGDWTTFGNGAAHTGYFPGTLAGDDFEPAWTASIGSQTLNPVAVGDGRVYVTPVTCFGDAFVLAVDASTGAQLWNHAFSSAFSINPPTYDNGRVYVQRGNHSGDTQLWAINAASGGSIWSAPFSAQWERYYAPAVCDQGIWIDGGGVGGMYGFRPDGTQIAFVSRDQYDQWAPSILGNYVYSQVAGDFSKYSMAGQVQWSNKASWSGGLMNRVPALAGNQGFLIGSPNLYSVNLADGTTAWTAAGYFTGSPAVANNVVYAISGNKILTFNAGTGSALSSYTVDEAISSQQPMVTDDALLVSSAAATYVFSLGTGALRERIPHSGQLSIANGMLYIAGSNGALYAYQATSPYPAALVTTPTLARQGDVAISYTLQDSDSEACAIQVQYSTDGGGTWLAATAGPGGDGTTSLTSSPRGETHSFVWDSIADLGLATVMGVKVRITPSGRNPGLPGISVGFPVKNGANQRPTATVTLSSQSPRTSDVLTATVTKADPDGDTVSLTFVWRVDGVITRTYTSSTSLIDSYSLSLAGNGDKGDVITVEVTPTDGVVEGAVATTDAATVVNSPPWLWGLNKTVKVGEVLSFALQGFPDVFQDADAGDSLRRVKITALPSYGLLRLGGVPVVAGDEIPGASLGQVTYTPFAVVDKDAITDSFGWSASDGSVYVPSIAKITVDASVLSSPIAYAIGASAAKAQTGDFNGDAILDIVTSSATGTVSVLLGRGDGTFASAVEYPIPGGVVGLRVGDFNGDGTQDLLLAESANGYNSGSGTVSLMPGNGDGTFGPRVDIGVPQRGIVGISVGDVNSDGHLDVILLERGWMVSWPYTSTDYVSVLLGNGDGSFSSLASFSTGATNTGVEAADLNGDGRLDLAITCSSNSVSILAGRGDGTFAPAADYPVAVQPTGLLVADFNADGKPDLATWNGGSGSAGTVSTLLNGGDGTFVARKDYDLAMAVVGAVAVDVNGDGNLDLAVAATRGYYMSRAVVLMGRGDGGFSRGIEGPTGAYFAAVAAGDFNGDGRPDVAAADGGYHSDRGSLQVLLNCYGHSPTATTPTLAQQGDTTISYTLQDSIAGSCGILAQYSVDGGKTWATATAGTGGDGESNLACSPTGIWHTFVWDSLSDIGHMTILDVRIRIVPDSVTGMPVMTGAFRVKNGPNRAPVATVVLDSGSPKMYGTLIATATKSDPDADPVSLTFVWKVNGIVKRTFTSVTALTDSFNLGAPVNGVSGDVVTVEVTPTDGTDDGTPVSATATIAANHAPTATVVLNSGSPKMHGTLTATATKSDPDADPVGLTFVWKVNGIVKRTFTSVTVLTDSFSLGAPVNGVSGDVVTVEVTSNDGIVDGTPVSATATIAVNHAPAATVALSAKLPSTGATLIATATKSDLDADPVSLSFVWKVNGVVKRTFTSATALADSFSLGAEGKGDMGDTVTVEVTPDDGIVSGAAAVDTATVTDRAPKLRGNVSKNATMGSKLAFSSADFAASFGDPDGDSLQKIKVTWLPALGTLRLGQTEVRLNQEIPVSELGELTYTPTSGGTDNFGWNGSDGDLYAAAGATVNMTVSKAAAQSVIIYSANPEIHYGEVLKVNIMVTVPDALGVLPTGSIRVCDTDGTVLQSVALVKGQASCSLAGLSRGHHDLSAKYSGDGTYKAVTSATPLSAEVTGANVVDILAVYTASAAQQAFYQGTSIKELIAEAVAQTNDALVNSEINLSVELVNVAQVSYGESGTYETDLERLKTPGDGYLDDVSSLRDAYGADLVCLFVGGMGSDRTAGLAYVMDDINGSDNADWGFSEVWVNDARSPSYAMAHELGHNFGARHDRDHADGRGVFDDSYGSRFQGGDGVWYHDIMSYDTEWDDVTIPYYANPNVSYAGRPTGQAGDADVARAINATAPVVANYRPTVVPLVTATRINVSPIGATYSDLPVTLRAKVKKLSANPYTPEGTVTFLDGDMVLGTCELTKGVATWTGVLPEGRTIRALYQSDGYFGDSLSAPATEMTIAEHAAAGTVVGSAAAPIDGRTLSYAITGGNAGGVFTIDGSTGLISVADPAGLDYELTPSCTLQVTASYVASGAVAASADVTVSLTDVNEAPADVTLSKTTVADRRRAGAVVGLLSAADPDAGDVFSYKLAGPDRALFTIDGNVLKTAATFKYEIKNSYTIRVRVTDKAGLSFAKDLTVNVTDTNRTPTSLGLSAGRVAENMPAGTTVGSFNTADPDIDSTFSYTLVDGEGSDDNAAFRIAANGRLKTNQAFDFETRNSYSVRVRSTDQGGLFCEQAITVKVTDVNEAPTDVVLSNYGVMEHLAAGTAVGKLAGSDPDAGGTLTYALIGGAGSRDNAKFKILNGKLRTASVFDYAAKNVYKVRVRVTDQDGLWFEKAMVVGVTSP